MPEDKIVTEDLEIVVGNPTTSLLKSNFQQAEEVADNIIAQTDALKDPYYAMRNIDTLETIKDIAGLASAKVLYYLMTNWNDFGLSDSFLDLVPSNIKLSRRMIQRYISIWETIFVSNLVPDDVKEELQDKPINSLVPIMGALKQGYKIDDDTWDKIIVEDKNQSIAKIIREDVKMNEKESDALYYLFDKLSGTLYVQNKGIRYVVGKLNLSSKDEPAQRAIVRLIEKLNVQIVEDK